MGSKRSTKITNNQVSVKPTMLWGPRQNTKDGNKTNKIRQLGNGLLSPFTDWLVY